MRSKRTPPIGPVNSLKPPGLGGALSGGAGSVIVLAVTLKSLFESGATPVSRLTSAIGTSIVIVPNDPSTNEHAPSAVIGFVPG